MNRRKFLTGSTVGISGLLAAPSPVFNQRKSSNEKSKQNIELAGMSLKALREKYRRDLFDDFLPFMDRYVIDHELGGFMCNADYTGERVNDNKSP